MDIVQTGGRGGLEIGCNVQTFLNVKQKKNAPKQQNLLTNEGISTSASIIDKGKEKKISQHDDVRVIEITQTIGTLSQLPQTF